MTKHKTSKLCVLTGALTVLGLVADTRPAFAGESCHAIDATAVGQNNGDLSTDAVLSDGGLLQGTTHTVFSPVGFDGTRLIFNGLVTFTTSSKATLDVAISGAFDFATGTFSAVSTDMTGTGKLSGATGTLALAGAEDPTGAFTETVTGQICIDRGR